MEHCFLLPTVFTSLWICGPLGKLYLTIHLTYKFIHSTAMQRGLNSSKVAWTNPQMDNNII